MAAAQPPNPPEGPQPQDEECIAPERVLIFVRMQAAQLDPGQSHVYATMSAARVKDSTELAQHILQAHLELQRRQGRGARTGRRAHAQRVYALLESTNTASLVLALAYLQTALGVLPASQSQHDD